MEIEKFALKKERAYKLWQEYVKACKENPKDRFLQDMKKVYNQLKSGRKIIDIDVAFQRSGLTVNGEPRIAIAQASTKEVICIYHQNGTVDFLNRESWDDYPMAKDVVIKDIFPEIPDGVLPKYESKKTMKAPVPVIPASLRPKGDLSKYYILWEVDEWKPIPPKDPYLLRRITKNMFVVFAGWKLTKLERAVMKGRVW